MSDSSQPDMPDPRVPKAGPPGAGEHVTLDQLSSTAREPTGSADGRDFWEPSAGSVAARIRSLGKLKFSLLITLVLLILVGIILWIAGKP